MTAAMENTTIDGNQGEMSASIQGQNLALGIALAVSSLFLGIGGMLVFFFLESHIWGLQFVVAMSTVICGHNARSLLRKGGIEEAGALLALIGLALGYPVLAASLYMCFVAELPPVIPSILALF